MDGREGRVVGDEIECDMKRFETGRKRELSYRMRRFVNDKTARQVVATIGLGMKTTL
jgi:hypothetical protein